MTTTTEQPTPAGPTSSFDQWLIAPDFQVDRDFIRFLGRTGEFRRQPALDAFAQQYYGLSSAAPVGRRLADMLGRVIKERRLLLQFRLAPLAPDAPPRFLICLSPGGEAAFARLAPREPCVYFSALQARYVSFERVYLVLTAREVLTRAGYAVDLVPEAIPLASGPKFKPDLLMRSATGAQIVQIERSQKFWMPATRARKWQRVMEATQGEVYLVADTAATMVQLRAEFRALRFDRWGVLHLTNLQQAEQFFAARGTVWMIAEALV